MSTNVPLTFVGFGFGPIQAGLFALEAFRSGNFRRVVIAEVMPDVVRSVREEGGKFQLNVANAAGIEPVEVGPVEMVDPAVATDRERLISAVAEASEIATAVPSIQFYKSDGPGSIHRILARGLERRLEGGGSKPLVLYAAENHNHAAEALEEAVLSEVPPDAHERVRASTRFLNTVIGKMSAVITDLDRIRATGLKTITAGDPRAFLVETFNRILISSIRFHPGLNFRRGITVFKEKLDLLPFEEAKLYGHNAAHALAAYIAKLEGLVRIEDIEKIPGAREFVRRTFLEESGEALCRKWGHVDILFSRKGFENNVEDLIQRMLNPNLGDLVERITRDPERKLGWDDRLVGTMRLCLAQNITPRGFAMGAAAGLLCHCPLARNAQDASEALKTIWRASRPDPAEMCRVLELVSEGLSRLRLWLDSGKSPF